MGHLNLEILRGTGFGYERATHLIDRPQGFSDEMYAAHAGSAAELVASVLTARPGSLLCMTGVVAAVVPEGLLSEQAITDQLRYAISGFDDDQTWREAHVIELRIPEVAGQV